MAYAQPRIHLGEWDVHISLGLRLKRDNLISVRRPNQVIVKKEKKICRTKDFVVSVDHRIKLKESEKKDIYFDLAGELKKNPLNMKVMVISIVIGALGIVTNGLIKGLEASEIRGQAETIQTTASLRSAWILRIVLETWGNLLSLWLQWKTIC